MIKQYKRGLSCISLYTAASEVAVVLSLLLRSLSGCGDGLGASIANLAEVDESNVTNAYGLNALRLLLALLSLACPTIDVKNSLVGRVS